MDAVKLARARLALEGLSVGDAFGQRFFVPLERAAPLVAERVEPAAPWGYTDDTEMALGIVEVLERCGHVERDELARVFARRYLADRGRGYGGTAHGILEAIGNGVPWRDAAGAVFDGMGSMGNGGGMRAAPVGGYFAEDPVETLIEEARASAEVTHAHPEGQAGAIAVALAAAHAWRVRGARGGEDELLPFVLAHAPDGETRAWIAQAHALGLECSVTHAASVLGTGSRVISQDTVPFALWCAARHLHDFEACLWTTVEGLGDRDTTCAIAGGVVALAVGLEGIPARWRAAREPLDGRAA